MMNTVSSLIYALCKQKKPYNIMEDYPKTIFDEISGKRSKLYINDAIILVKLIFHFKY